MNNLDNDDDNDIFASSSDDDMILELSTRPPRFTQVQNTINNDYTQSQLPALDTLPSNATQNVTNANGNATVTAVTRDNNNLSHNDLMKAQGEASMLRDKLKVLQSEKEKELINEQSKNKKLKESHLDELNKLKHELQRLEDEKKFLIMENKSSLKSRSTVPALSNDSDNNRESSVTLSSESMSASNTAINNTATAIKTSPSSKRRKIGQTKLKKQYIQLNPNRVTPDETSVLFENIMLHRLVGCDLNTIEMLSRIKLEYIENFQFKSFIIPKGESIGKSLISLFLRCKKGMKLDNFIDTLLEHIAVLIKEISFHEREFDLAVPFLVVIMFELVNFRPSAVHIFALKDLFYFTCDLIKKYQHVLKKPVRKTPLDMTFGPQIFQYEFIDLLIVLFSFDLLELSLRILQLHPISEISDFLDSKLLKSLEQLFSLTLTLSYKPIINVIYNTVEMLNILSTILVTAQSDPQNVENAETEDPIIPPQWWKMSVTRLYNVLSKQVSNHNLYSDISDDEEANVNHSSNNNLNNNNNNNMAVKNDVLTISRFTDLFSLIRNMGNNTIAPFISELISEEKLSGIPEVISKEDILISDPEKIDFKLERWFLYLKDDILNILENLLMVYPEENTLINGEMLIQLTKLMSKEQEMMIVRHVGQQSTNLGLRCDIVDHILVIIYRLWTDHYNQLSEENIKEIENELVVSLWKVIVSQTAEKEDYDAKEMNEHRQLVDKFNELSLKDQVLYFDDTLEDIPEYIEQDLKKDLDERCQRIMQVRYRNEYQEMAKTILESKFLVSLENIDSLYDAMGL
ncbi:Lcd1p NDAI_0F04310 [Naumovozyma dairenensis CBS 421]|uniref:DNA damage checkpoint protein LCD1 n=1 Tax=Naumovozyma dairenensis (strain ATCC 10597 / BCRC 20456 / CBS 421 / NBRC 0211 / NRRL Y-12639) TaxID=1071378 RepID=G0WD88_NAUDC|nr:hypothetical protein NDAI_0F04310 [Naumovozyma dairenensis CBS 421]CCD25749.1 hypothetical protein NDAI_0F04310 [Naumovozyma dairenensis CBS 421]